MATPLNPTTRADFAPGPAIKPCAVLLDWLNNKAKPAAGPRKRIRLPVVIRFEDSFRLAIGEAFVGASEADVHKDTIFLSLDDSGMGMDLLSKLRAICPQTADSCGVWLEGYWGSLLQLDLPKLSLPKKEAGKTTQWPFAVLKVHQLIGEQPGPDEELRAFIEP